MRQHAERINIALLVELSKLKRVIALIGIKDKQVTRSYCTRLHLGVKALQLLNSKLARRAPIVTDCGHLVA